MTPHRSLRASRSRRRRATLPTLLLTVAAHLALLGASPATARAQPLFRSDAPLPVTITTNLRELVKERDSTDLQWFGAEFTYSAGDSTVTLPVELRARGHFRRQRGNCAFPPLWVRVRDDLEKGTELQGNPRIKLVTPCRPDSDDYQQYILLEYGVYRAYQTVLPVHPRTRLATITYRDSANRMDPLTVHAFFSEREEEVAKEHHVDLRDSMTGARFGDVDAPTLQSIALFSLMVGNSDWSLGGLHNIYLLQDSLGLIKPVAYDWDWVGLVNARYARPDYRLPIKSVVQRYYMGPCYTPQEWQPAVTVFKSKRAELDAVWAGIPGLDEKRRDQTTKYLAEFWKVLDNPGDFARLTKSCRREGN